MLETQEPPGGVGKYRECNRSDGAELRRVETRSRKAFEYRNLKCLVNDETGKVPPVCHKPRPSLFRKPLRLRTTGVVHEWGTNICFLLRRGSAYLLHGMRHRRGGGPPAGRETALHAVIKPSGQAPHLQIVSDEVWGAVEHRLDVVKASFAAGTSPGLCCRSLSAQYLLSGFLKCGVCGTKMVVVSGRGQSGRARYGCPMKHARGVCTNNLHLRQDTLEREIICGLQSRVLREDVAAYAVAEFRRQLKAKLEGARSQLSTLRQEREKLKAEISNIAAVIAQGRQSPALLDELEKRERRLTEISDEIFSSSGNGLDAKLKGIEDFVMRRLGDLHGLLNGDVQRAKSELAKHCTEITLTPKGQTYQVSGDWNLLGGRSDGAGGQNRTGYARLFRAALYQ